MVDIPEPPGYGPLLKDLSGVTTADGPLGWWVLL